MDLMADIGSADQLTSAREENKVLKCKVLELSSKVKELTLSCATLQAEVEIYRSESSLPSFSNLALGGQQQQQQPIESSSTNNSANNSKFISSGNGIYPMVPIVSLANLHGSSNPLCCAIHPTSDTVLATGGADGFLSLVTWGSAMAPDPNATTQTVQNASKIKCDAPVICVAISKLHIVAGGCMDGSVRLLAYETGQTANGGGVLAKPLGSGREIRHTKYVKFVHWSTDGTLLATGSADGTVQFTRVVSSDNTPPSLGDDTYMDDGDNVMGGTAQHHNHVTIEKVRTLHLNGPIEAGCFLDAGNRFCLYERGTSYLSYFDLNDDFKMTKQSLNGSVTGGFDEHVSFTVMHLSPSPDETCICAATDSSRNIVLQVLSKTTITGDGINGTATANNDIIRDLYGHKNDGYSQPRVAWSKNGQYIFGTTQDDCDICVWDIASAEIVKRLGGAGENGHTGGHKGQIRDIFSSTVSDTLVSASFDKTIKVWLNDM